MMSKHYQYVSLALTVLTVAACQEKNRLDVNDFSAENSEITIVADMSCTKAPLSGPCLEYPLGLFALSSGDAGGLHLYADNRKFTGDDLSYGGNQSNTVFSGNLYWPENGELRFLGYSPYMEGVHAQINGDSGNWTMDISIPVNNNRPDQDDLVGACDMTRSFNRASHLGTHVPMEYDHLMSSVQFEFWSETPVYIADVSFNNVCVEATQHLTATSATRKWDGEWIDRVSPTEPYSMMAGGKALLLSREEECASPASDGGLVHTGRNLDIGIDDDVYNFSGAYFQVEVNGELKYTRNGRFHLNQDGTVVDINGNILQPEFAVPAETDSLHISRFGHIAALDSRGCEVAAAEIPLYTFIAEGWLERGEDGYYTPTEHSGAELEGVPGQDNVPMMRQGYWNSTDDNYRKANCQFEVAIRDVFHEYDTPAYFAVNYNGETLYTRDGRFSVNEDGALVTANCPKPEEHDWVFLGSEDKYYVSPDTRYFGISAFGVINCDNGYSTVPGIIKCYSFDHPEFLEARNIRGQIYYAVSTESGEAVECNPIFQYGARNVSSAYTTDAPCVSMRKFLCIPDRKENEPASEVPAGRSISITVVPLDIPGASPVTKVLPIENEFVQGHCYTYKINCSKILDRDSL